MNKTINEATGLEIELDNDYTYDGSSDSELKDGIIINKSITIDGKGKTISGNGQARIFNIVSGAVVIIKNLNLINANANMGGAIYVDSGNLTITYSNLTHNKASENGAAIYITKEGTVIIDNAIFANNDAAKRGGGIYNTNGQLTVNNSLFENNTAYYDGGAIISYNKKFTITKSTFKGNKARDLGGAVCNKYGIMFITECVFENNEIGDRGGALYTNTVSDSISEQDKYQHISYSNFTNNIAKGTYVSGGAIYFTGYLNATGNIFTNNHGGTQETIDLGGFWTGTFALPD